MQKKIPFPVGSYLGKYGSMYCCFCTAAPQKFYSDKPFFFQIPLPRSFLRQCGGKATMGSALPILFHGSLFGIVHQRKVGIEEGFSRFLFLLRRCLSFSFFRNVKTNSDCAGGKPMKTILILEKFKFSLPSRFPEFCSGSEISDFFSNTIRIKLVSTRRCLIDYLHPQVANVSFLDFDLFVD